MFSAALTRTLTQPAFVADDFVPTKWDTAEQKAKFANTLLLFIAQNFPQTKFNNPFYKKLSNTFGHIAHYNRDGFYTTFFLTAATKLEFLEQCITWPFYGDPTYTYCDVERAVVRRLHASQIITLLRSQIAVERRDRELALLSKLKARYEPITTTPATQTIDLFA